MCWIAGDMGAFLCCKTCSWWNTVVTGRVGQHPQLVLVTVAVLLLSFKQVRLEQSDSSVLITGFVNTRC